MNPKHDQHNQAKEPPTTKPLPLDTTEALSTDLEPVGSTNQTSVEEIIDRLLEKIDGAPDGTDRREGKRTDWMTASIIWIEKGVATGHFSRAWGATTHDLSVGGMSFIHIQQVRAGAAVRLRLDALPDAPALTGIVRSCVSLGGAHFRISVEFLDVEHQA